MIDPDELEWHFDKLIKTIIAMSLPYKKQQEIYGGSIADDMLEDFYTHYEVRKHLYLSSGIINKSDFVALDKIAALSKTWSQEKEESFWFEMEEHQVEWDYLRKLAAAALTALGKQHLQLKIHRESTLDQNSGLIVHKTKIQLFEP